MSESYVPSSNRGSLNRVNRGREGRNARTRVRVPRETGPMGRRRSPSQRSGVERRPGGSPTRVPDPSAPQKGGGWQHGRGGAGGGPSRVGSSGLRLAGEEALSRTGRGCGQGLRAGAPRVTCRRPPAPPGPRHGGVWEWTEEHQYRMVLLHQSVGPVPAAAARALRPGAAAGAAAAGGPGPPES